MATEMAMIDWVKITLAMVLLVQVIVLKTKPNLKTKSVHSQWIEFDGKTAKESYGEETK